MISSLPVSDRTRSILRGAIAVLAVLACYEATARSGHFAPALLPPLGKVAATLWTLLARRHHAAPHRDDALSHAVRLRRSPS